MRQELKDKIDKACELLHKAERLAELYDPTDGFWLAFSGGKDSQALYHIAMLAGVRFKAHYNPTTIDPPEVVRFIRTQYPDVVFEPIKRSLYQQAVSSGLPNRMFRWCCLKFKELGGGGKIKLIGIRREESGRRAKRNEIEVSTREFSGDMEAFKQWRKEKLNSVGIDDIDTDTLSTCISGKDSIIISPIIEWTEQDVWEFLNDVVKVPHCSLYDEGQHRIGCIFCPLNHHYELHLKEAERYPEMKHRWLDVIKKYRAKRGNNALVNNYWFADDEDTIAENIFDWWIYGKSYNEWVADKHS